MFEYGFRQSRFVIFYFYQLLIRPISSKYKFKLWKWKLHHHYLYRW